LHNTEHLSVRYSNLIFLAVARSNFVKNYQKISKQSASCQ